VHAYEQQKKNEEEEVHILAFWKETFWLWKEKHFGLLVTFWFGTFGMLFCTTTHVVGHENT